MLRLEAEPCKRPNVTVLSSHPGSGIRSIRVSQVGDVNINAKGNQGTYKRTKVKGSSRRNLPRRNEYKAHASFTRQKKPEDGVSENHARRTGPVRSSGLDLQRNLGGLIEAFSDAAVLDSGAF